jgi:hypothetical protein
MLYFIYDHRQRFSLSFILQHLLKSIEINYNHQSLLHVLFYVGFFLSSLYHMYQRWDRFVFLSNRTEPILFNTA